MLLVDVDIRGKRICDIGVGPGFTSLLLSEYEPLEIISIEPSEGVGGKVDVFDNSMTILVFVEKMNRLSP